MNFKKHDHSNMYMYINTPEFYTLTAENFTARSTQANLERKNDIAALVKKTDFDDKSKN